MENILSEKWKKNVFLLYGHEHIVNCNNAIFMCSVCDLKYVLISFKEKFT